MPILENAKHEHFAQEIAKGVSPSKAYVSAGYSEGGAAQSAARLLTNANVRARVSELQETILAGVIPTEICEKNARIQSLQLLWDRMKSLLAARARDDDEGQIATGLVCKDFKGKDATQQVLKFDAALVEELRETAKMAALELGQLLGEKERKKADEAAPPTPPEPPELACLTNEELEFLASIQRKVLAARERREPTA